jgi:membrane protease YdiL (CAAX protease family)
MINFESILYIILPIVLVFIILPKKNRFEPNNSFWINQKWQCFDVLIIVMCLSLFQLFALVLGKYEIVNYYHIFIYGNFFSKAALGVLLFGLLHRKYKNNFIAIGLSSTGVLSKVAIGLATFILYTLFIIAISFFVSSENIFYVWAQFFIKIKLNQWPLLDSFIYIFGLVILAPFVEECIFRGLMYGPFQRKIGKVGSICLTAIIWAVAHFQIKSLLSLFFIGIILCYLYKRTNSLIPGIIAHSMMNISNLFIYAYLMT